MPDRRGTPPDFEPFEERAGRLIRVTDRTGHIWAQLDWDHDRLVQLTVPGAIVHGEVTRDPLLGAAQVIECSPGGHTAMSALDWAHPTEIPAIAAPGRLPAGSGGAILNVIAILAERAHIPALRYAGPYPTSALWRALARSFHTTASEHEFTANAIERMLRLAREPIAIDFVPAPHERVAIPGGHGELRTGLERVTIDGVTYEPEASPARLDAHSHRAELWFGDAPYAHIATFSDDGTAIHGPHPVPPCTSDVVNKAFPPPLVAAIAELVADAVPAPLASDTRRWIADRSIRWADLGARAARATPEGLVVHAAIWQHVGPFGLGRLALALAEALAPVVTTALLAEVMARRS
jgi:hypothetical protein